MRSSLDVAIILVGDEFAHVLADVQIPIRVGVRGHVLAPFLTTTYDIRSPKDWGPPKRLEALRALGHDVHNVMPSLWVSDHARIAAQATSELGLPEAVPYAVVHPFGSTPAQWWPLDRTAELAEALRREHNLWTIVVGGPETRGKLGTAPRNTIDATGAITISELIAVIERARLVISTDSGPFRARRRTPTTVGRFVRARHRNMQAAIPRPKSFLGKSRPAPSVANGTVVNRSRAAR